MRLEIAAEKFKTFAPTSVKPLIDKLALARTGTLRPIAKTMHLLVSVINAPISSLKACKRWQVGAMPKSFSQGKILIPHTKRFSHLFNSLQDFVKTVAASFRVRLWFHTCQAFNAAKSVPFNAKSQTGRWQDGIQAIQG